MTVERLARESWHVAVCWLTAALVAAGALAAGPVLAWTALVLGAVAAAASAAVRLALWRQDIREARAELERR